jgi:hypothetical protein
MSIASRERVALNRQHVGLTRPEFLDVIRGEASAVMQAHALAKLKKLTPLGREADPQQKRVALQYGLICGRAYARRMGRYYGLFDKYAPGGSLAATN